MYPLVIISKEKLCRRGSGPIPHGTSSTISRTNSSAGRSIVSHCLHKLFHSGIMCRQRLLSFVNIQTSFHIDYIEILSCLQAYTASSASDVCGAVGSCQKSNLRNRLQGKDVMHGPYYWCNTAGSQVLLLCIPEQSCKTADRQRFC